MPYHTKYIHIHVYTSTLNKHKVYSNFHVCCIRVYILWNEQFSSYRLLILPRNSLIFVLVKVLRTWTVIKLNVSAHFLIYVIISIEGIPTKLYLTLILSNNNVIQIVEKNYRSIITNYSWKYGNRGNFLHSK